MIIADILDQHSAQIQTNATLHDAAQMVARSGASDLMVVDADGRFVGILSEEMILATMLPDTDEVLAIGGSVEDAYGVFLEKGARAAQRPILPLVTRSAVLLCPNVHIAEAAIVLAGQPHRHLPVVENGRLRGTVSRAAVCRAAMGEKGQEECRSPVRSSLWVALRSAWSKSTDRVRQCMGGVSGLVHPQTESGVSELA